MVNAFSTHFKKNILYISISHDNDIQKSKFLKMMKPCQKSLGPKVLTLNPKKTTTKKGKGGTKSEYLRPQKQKKTTNHTNKGHKSEK
jgi:hypothetical protein